MNSTALLPFMLAGGFFLSGCGGEPDPSADARRWLELEIDRPEPEPEAPEIAEELAGEVETELLTNTYLVRPSFLTSAPGTGSPNPDPFAAPDPGKYKPPRKLPPQQVLEAYGVEFGPGASAFYSKKDRTMRVTQTQEQMDLVEAIISSLIGSGAGDWSTVTVRFEIYEIPAEMAVDLERSASEHFEHTPELNAVLEQVKSGRARIVTTANLLCRSGQRTTYRNGIESPEFGDPETNEEGDDSQPVRMRFPTRFVGTEIEADPVVGPDSRTLDINFQIEHSFPASSDAAAGRIMRHTMKSGETTLSGAVKLLGSWPANEGMSIGSRIVFLKATTTADMLRRRE